MLGFFKKTSTSIQRAADVFVSALESFASGIYSFLFHWNSENIKRAPRNLHLFSILALSLAGVLIYFSSDWVPKLNWKATNAHLSYLKIDQIELSPANPRGPYDYRVSMQYRYRFEGKLYAGGQIVSGVEQIFNKRSDIDRLLGGASPGESIKVFVNPNKPSESAILAGPMSLEVFVYLFGGFLLYILILVALAKALKIG